MDDTVSGAEGCGVGFGKDMVAFAVGLGAGTIVARVVGANEGTFAGGLVFILVGAGVLFVRRGVGATVGAFVGILVFTVGAFVGRFDGGCVGSFVSGGCVGSFVGICVGAGVGILVGATVAA